MSYTPGPWKAQSFAGEWLVWGNSKGRAVAYQVEEKNARLIAAAPEAVAIIEKYLACAAAPHKVVLVDIDDEARALLARIKGEA